MNVEQEILALQERNKKVTCDKETLKNSRKVLKSMVFSISRKNLYERVSSRNLCRNPGLKLLDQNIRYHRFLRLGILQRFHKSRETSGTRKVAIAVLTYIVVVLFFLYMGIDRPWQSAMVPTLGFLLSTLSLDILKKYRITYFYVPKSHVDGNKK